MRRDDFKAFEKNKDLIYLDSSATSLKPEIVAIKICDYYKYSGASVHRGIYSVSEKVTEEYENSRDKVRDFIGASDSSEIVFTSGTTDSANKIFMSLSNTYNDILKEGDEIIVSVMEHNSIIVPLQKFAKRHRLKINYIGLNNDNEFDLELFYKLYSNKTKFVVVMHVSNVLGVTNPIKQIAEYIQSKAPKNMLEDDIYANLLRPIFIVDGAQAVIHEDINVKKLNVDFYMFSAHKMFGPTGIGIFYGKKKLLSIIDPSSFGGHAVFDVSKENVILSDIPARFEPGTPNISGVIGLGVCIDYINSIGFEDVKNHTVDLFNYAFEKLSKIEKIKLYLPKTLCPKNGILSFNYGNIHPHDVVSILDRNNICIRGGHHCAMILLKELGINGCCRISFSIYNTRYDIDKLIASFKKIDEIFGDYNG